MPSRYDSDTWSVMVTEEMLKKTGRADMCFRDSAIKVNTPKDLGK